MNDFQIRQYEYLKDRLERRVDVKFSYFPEKKYNLIVVDPPWPMGSFYADSSGQRRETSPNYDVLTIDEIKRLPVLRIAAQKCVLFLWTIRRHLHESFHLLKDYGFTYYLTMVWHKSRAMSLSGFYWNAEFILVGYRGKGALPQFPKRPVVRTCFQADSHGHSIKPDEFYEMVKVFGDKRIDLFARKEREGWDVWGDEV